MLLYIPTEMQEFIGNGTQLDADSGTCICFPKFLEQVRVLHEGEAVADALRVEGDCVVEIGFCGVVRATCVKERFAGVEHKGDFQIQCFACFLKGNELGSVKVNMVGAVFGADEIESWRCVRC